MPGELDTMQLRTTLRHWLRLPCNKEYTNASVFVTAAAVAAVIGVEVAAVAAVVVAVAVAGVFL